MVVQKQVSIIIPSYNDGRYLKEALDSVLSQDYTYFEIIIVDDGSTDNDTQQYLSQLNHHKIKVFLKEHEGVSIARNYAIAKSTGDYILPLDADDLIGKDFIREAVEVLDSNNKVKIVCCKAEMFGAKKGPYPLPDPSLEMLLGQNTMVITSMFRKTDFEMTKGFNPNMSTGFEDWDFWLTLLEQGGEIYKLDKVGFYYRIKKGSRNNVLTSDEFKRLRLQIYLNHQELYAKHFFDPLKSFEYDLIINSKEFKLGQILMKPIRFIHKFFN